jgi:hypothetical protein
MVGAWVRNSVLGATGSISAIDLPLGYSIGSVVILISARIGLGVGAAGIILLFALMYAATRLYMLNFRMRWTCGISGAIAASFAVCVIFAYIPFLWDYGSAYHPPQIFDAPKHIFTITALQGSTSWPPRNPFMPGLDYAYNFGFYAVPSLFVALTGDSRLGISILPWVAGISAWSVVVVTLEVANKLGTPRLFMPIVAIAATWLGGLTPLLVETYPALGFRLATEGFIQSNLWADEPFVSAIFVPQHLFSTTCVLATICLAMSQGEVWRRAALAAVMSLSGSLSSLILLPHISIILVISVAVMFISKRSGEGLVKTAFVVAAYCAVLLPFVVEAASWQGGSEEAVFGYSPSLGTIGFVLLAIGPVVVLASIAIIYGVRAGEYSSMQYIIISLAVALFGALTLKYSEAPFKSTLLLRAILPTLSGIGFAVIWNVLRTYSSRAALGLALSACVAINIPTMWFFSAATLRPYEKSEQLFIRELQRAKAPILFEGASHQFLAALAVKQTILDFRANRADAYLPQKERLSYARFFDSNDRSIIDLSTVGAAVYPQGTVSAFAGASGWAPGMSAMGFTLIGKNR